MIYAARSGVDGPKRVKPAILQIMMRHNDIRTTMERYYAELDSEDASTALIWGITPRKQERRTLSRTLNFPKRETLLNSCKRRVSEWLAASLEMKCPARGCEFESRALRSYFVDKLMPVERARQKSIVAIGKTKQRHGGSVDAAKFVRIDETAVDFRQGQNQFALLLLKF